MKFVWLSRLKDSTRHHSAHGSSNRCRSMCLHQTERIRSRPPEIYRFRKIVVNLSPVVHLLMCDESRPADVRVAYKGGLKEIGNCGKETSLAFRIVARFYDFIGGPDRDRTDDLFHAMEARSQLRHRPTCGVQLLHCLYCKQFRQSSLFVSVRVLVRAFGLSA